MEYEVKKPDSMERLGNGSYGVAYAYSDTVVCKITSDPLEVCIARKMVGHKFSRTWEVFEVRSLTEHETAQHEGTHRNFRSAKLYAIFGERLYKLGAKISSSVNNGFWGAGNSTLELWKAQCNEELGRIGLAHRDQHPGNMGQTKGGRGHGRPRVKFFDVRAHVDVTNLT